MKIAIDNRIFTGTAKQIVQQMQSISFGLADLPIDKYLDHLQQQIGADAGLQITFTDGATIDDRCQTLLEAAQAAGLARTVTAGELERTAKGGPMGRHNCRVCGEVQTVNIREPICGDCREGKWYKGTDKQSLGDGVVTWSASERCGSWWLFVVARETETLRNFDGPFESFDRAMESGEGVARMWCADNGIKR